MISMLSTMGGQWWGVTRGLRHVFLGELGTGVRVHLDLAGASDVDGLGNVRDVFLVGPDSNASLDSQTDENYECEGVEKADRELIISVEDALVLGVLVDAFLVDGVHWLNRLSLLLFGMYDHSVGFFIFLLMLALFVGIGFGWLGGVVLLIGNHNRLRWFGFGLSLFGWLWRRRILFGWLLHSLDFGDFHLLSMGGLERLLHLFHRHWHHHRFLFFFSRLLDSFLHRLLPFLGNFMNLKQRSRVPEADRHEHRQHNYRFHQRYYYDLGEAQD